MKKLRLTLGIISIVATVMIVYSIKTNQRNRTTKRLISISDAGYETAFDVLYPLKRKKFWRR